MVFEVVRRIVSKQKRRFQTDNFDLDLTYITPRVIAMGFPSHNSEAMYRNPYDEVKNFFDTYHNNHYLIVNLCIEPNRQYDSQLFDGNVMNFQFYDHNPPSFKMIIDCCRSLQQFLEQDNENIVAVHCKAGKGRTGTIIVCLLLFTQVCRNAKEALNFYALQRTYDYKGVTIPSQRRYCGYFSKYLELFPLLQFPTDLGVERPISYILEEEIPKDKYDKISDLACKFVSPSVNKIDFSTTFRLKGIGLHGDIKFRDELVYTIEIIEYEINNDSHYSRFNVIYESDPIDFVTDYATVMPDCPLSLAGDLRFVIYSGEKHLFQFTINTGFLKCKNGVSNLVLTKNELDDAVKDKNHSVYPMNFHVICQFEVAGTLASLVDSDYEFISSGYLSPISHKSQKNKMFNSNNEKDNLSSDEEFIFVQSPQKQSWRKNMMNDGNTQDRDGYVNIEDVLDDLDVGTVTPATPAIPISSETSAFLSACEARKSTLLFEDMYSTSSNTSTLLSPEQRKSLTITMSKHLCNSRFENDESDSDYEDQNLNIIANYF
eukprot:TRINITY_DN3247_c1_g2_i1.p1 TRINITY_DN3247_c1_g2~~TRINITY_DN3247_c1_g2_i1.p1  ORF type:complete len:544 (+),score=112.87 TRINITY_DN3247_c1_g2_i1:68-1699(+)